MNVSRMAEVEKLALELPHGKIILLEFKGLAIFSIVFAHEQSNAWPIKYQQSIASANEASPAHGINCRFHPQL